MKQIATVGNFLKKGFEKSVIAQLLFLSVMVLLVYHPVLFNKFQMEWDDQWMVFNSYTTSGFTIENIKKIIFEFYGGQYGPVNQLYYTLIYSLFGYNPFWFHSIGLILHIANVLLVYILLKNLLLFSKAFGLDSIQRISFVTALLMAIHPFLVEAVAWISASKVLLYGFFYLLSLNFYSKYIVRKKAVHFLAVLFFFILSFGAKEQAVTLPFCLLLIDYISKRDLKSSGVWIEKAPFFILSIFFGVVTIYSQSRALTGIVYGLADYPFYQRIIFASYSLTEYLIKCIVPVKLSFVYPFPNEIGKAVPIRFWFYPLMLLISAVYLFYTEKRKWIIFGVGFFAVHLLTVIHLISISRYAIVADRYVYLSSIGIFFLIACLINNFLVSKNYYRYLIISLSVIYVLLLFNYTVSRNKLWFDSNSLKKELNEWLKQKPTLRKPNNV